MSEGRHVDIVDAVAAVAGRTLLDVHSDPFHNRSVLTLAGAGAEAAARAVAAEAVRLLDISTHEGAHPRLGVVDVVPFVPLSLLGGVAKAEAPQGWGDQLGDALDARGAFVEWFAAQGVPCFSYGPERTLPQIRRSAFRGLAPDAGPLEPHPTAGACCVGARPLLVAYNLVLAGGGIGLARRIAAELRQPG
ncbi:MAG: glutamate formimidoyltransferase, partial [Acidimicrobiales bacterium]